MPGLFAEPPRARAKPGFDGVELHYAHAYTMASFLSRTNTREDGYGGPRENRVRLPLEVFRRGARARRRTIMSSAAAFSPTNASTAAATLDGRGVFRRRIRPAGMDFLSLSARRKVRGRQAAQASAGRSIRTRARSGYECMPQFISDARGPFGRNVDADRGDPRARSAPRASTTPVVATGGVHSFEMAEKHAGRAAQCDIVGAARQTLADPDWFRKIALGRGGEVRHLRVHELLRRPRPEAQAGDLQIVGSRCWWEKPA